MSLFSAVEMAPRDPILGLNEAFNADTRPGKINLGVGVYYNEEGRIPLLRAVQAAEKARIEAHAPRGYLPIEGIAAYDQGVQKLLFGNESELLAAGRVVTTQAVGGTGALKLGADFLKRLLPDATVAISDPSWENHRALFEAAGFPVQNYRYYDAASNGVNRAGLLEDLNALPARSIVVLHACCHNPTGVDLELDDWKQVLDVLKAKGHVPFLDIAYQGFGNGIEEDAAAVRLFAQSGLSFFVSSSFSKSFSLYGERVGALSIVTESRDESARVLSQVKRVIRTNYSNPTDPRRQRRLLRAQQPGTAGPLGAGTGRDARPHPRHAPGDGRATGSPRRQARLQLRRSPTWHVLLFRPDRRPGRAPEDRVRYLRRQHRPYLRRRAEQIEPGDHHQGHRPGPVGKMGKSSGEA
ncbi:aromatic amino acid aminotransferase [Pseudomonas aeruginosa]|nr:aromatic amino acid aminotransferase [Pseudomonas aeruginosa]